MDNESKRERAREGGREYDGPTGGRREMVEFRGSWALITGGRAANNKFTAETRWTQCAHCRLRLSAGRIYNPTTLKLCARASSVTNLPRVNQRRPPNRTCNIRG